MAQKGIHFQLMCLTPIHARRTFIRCLEMMQEPVLRPEFHQHRAVSGAAATAFHSLKL